MKMLLNTILLIQIVIFFRQITGAMVILSDTDEISADGRERTITIKGPKESVTLARYLINAR